MGEVEEEHMGCNHYHFVVQVPLKTDSAKSPTIRSLLSGSFKSTL